MSESSPAPQTGNPPPKRRNPIELFLVRGFIVAMLILIAVEGNSWWQHRQAMAALGTMMKAVDEVPDCPAVTEADVKKLFGGKEPVRRGPPEAGNNFTGASRIDVYSWFTISPVNKREIYVYYGQATKDDVNGPEVLAVQGKDEPPPAPPQVAGDEQPPPEAGAGPGMMMPGMGGPRGGRGGRPGGHAEEASAEDGGKPDAKKPDAEKPAENKAGDDKPKAGDDKPKDTEAEKEQQ